MTIVRKKFILLTEQFKETKIKKKKKKQSFISARRARQFYRMKQTTLCDICEGSDCNENCQIRALKQESAPSIFEEIEASAKSVPGKSAATTIQLIEFLTIILTFLLTARLTM